MGFDLAAILKGARPRENSGSPTNSRYGFQANVAILKAFDLREARQEFVLVFDLFDDLVILDTLSTPTAISLYQVKGKDPGEWSIADLCRDVGKEAPKKILSRLYAHSVVFGPALGETGFITNAPYKLRLANGEPCKATQHRIETREIHADELAKIEKAVLADIDPADVPAWLPKLVLLRTTLGVHGQELVIKGRLLEHFDQLGVADGVNITGVYETLHAAIEQRARYSEEESDQTEIFRRKSLNSSDIDDLISRASATRRGFLADWETIRADLADAGVGSLEIIRLKTHAVVYRQSRQTGQPQAAHLAEHIGRWSAANREAIDACTTLSRLMDVLRASLADNFGYGERELRAALIVEAYEVINGAP